MHVLFVTHCTVLAGANRSMLQLIEELHSDYNVDPYVLYPKDSGSELFRKTLDSKCIPGKDADIRFYKQSVITASKRLEHLKSLNNQNELFNFLISGNFDLVYSNSSVIDIGVDISNRLGIPHVYHIREFGELHYSLKCLFGNLYERLLYCTSSACISVSKAIEQYYSTKIPHKKSHLIYNGICFKEGTVLSKHNADVFQFVCAGIICNSKNQMEILYAANELINNRKETRFHVSFVGRGDAEYVEKMVKYIKDKNIGAHVSFLGEKDGISGVLKDMDAGIVPSNNEAFGRVTVEYMLQNLAVIANDSGANSEIVVDEKTGLIYESGDVIGLSNRMQILINDRDKLISLSSEGNKRAKSMFLSMYNTKSVYELFKSLKKSVVYSEGCYLLLKSYRFYWYIRSLCTLKIKSFRK